MSKVSVAVPVYNVENYIYDMLKSVQEQTFGDFEVLIIDDGSEDGSPDIAKKFCAADQRFKYFRQENAGVAAARNKAIDMACGEYIVFYDPDDYIPPEALKKMYKTALSGRADMVVGVMEEKNLGESLIYMHSQKLAKQKKIKPTDDHFIGAWSLCHKMFSLRLLKQNNIKFEKLYNAEDGVFTYTVLGCAERICGCDTVAYNYIKRPFWLTPSATQTISRKYLESLLKSHDRIMEEVDKLADKHMTAEEKQAYMGKLCYRFIEGEMINGYYRGLWRAEEDLTDALTERTDYYRRFLTDEQWNKLLRAHKDLDLSGGFMSPAQMAQSPSVSIIVDTTCTPDELNMILGSIYNQAFPRFEVLATPETAEAADGSYRAKANFRVLDGSDFLQEAAELAKGRYIAIFREFAMYTKFSLKQMADRLEANHQSDFASMIMKTAEGSGYAPIPVLSAAFGYTKRGRRGCGRLALCDNKISNKLFRKSALTGVQCQVIRDCTEGQKLSEVMELYSSLRGERLRKGAMITDMREEDFLAGTAKPPSRFAISLGHFKNGGIDRAVQRLKRHITREDIDNFKRKLGK